MKTIQSVFATGLFMLVCIGCIYTQSETLYNLKSNLVQLEADYADVKIETWKENYIQVESDVKVNMFEGKEHHDLVLQNNVDGITIKSIVNTDDVEQMVITVNNDGKKTYTPMSKWDDTDNRKKNYNRLNIGYEIDAQLTVFVPEHMFMEIKTTYGDVVMDGTYKEIETCSTYGMIEAKLSNVSNMKKVSFNSTYDIVDLTLDKSSDATLKLNTTYGEVYSDLPLESQSTTTKNHSNSCTKFSEKYVLNSGDVNIDIVATYDNIYVRSN